MTEQTPLVLDVRDDLRNGREPFGRIMEAVASLQDGQAMLLIAIMEPVPLYEVMAGRGFAHETSRTPRGSASPMARTSKCATTSGRSSRRRK